MHGSCWVCCALPQRKDINQSPINETMRMNLIIVKEIAACLRRRERHSVISVHAAFGRFAQWRAGATFQKAAFPWPL